MIHQFQNSLSDFQNGRQQIRRMQIFVKNKRFIFYDFYAFLENELFWSILLPETEKYLYTL